MSFPDGVVIVQGAFDTKRLISLANLSFGVRAVQQTHGGTSLHTWTLNNQAPQAGMMPQMRELSMAALDGQTLVAGTPTGVRECLDVYHAGGNNEPNSELVKLTTQNPAALIAVGFKLKPLTDARNTNANSSAGSRSGLRLDGIDKFGTSPAGEAGAASTNGNNSFTKMLESIEQVHASVGMTALALDTLLIARTKTIEQAEELNNTIAGLRQMLESSFTNSSNARSPFSNLKISANGNEVRIHLQITQNEIASLMATAPVTRRRAPASPLRTRRSPRALRR